MKKNIILLSLIIFAFSANAFAQRKAVSGAEVTGTFKGNDPNQTQEFKIQAIGNGKLKVEFYVGLKLGPNGEPNGNTAFGSGIAEIEGDAATFVPEGQDLADCNITLFFKKPNVLVVTQKGTCGFINEMLSTEATYKKVSAKKPKFND